MPRPNLDENKYGGKKKKKFNESVSTRFSLWRKKKNRFSEDIAVNPVLLFRVNEFAFIQFWCGSGSHRETRSEKGEIANYFSVWRNLWHFWDQTVRCDKRQQTNQNAQRKKNRTKYVYWHAKWFVVALIPGDNFSRDNLLDASFNFSSSTDK